MPGKDDEELEIAAEGLAETISLMVKGGCPLEHAIKIVSCRSAAWESVQGEVMNLVAQYLAPLGIDVKDVVRKPGISESFDYEKVENGDLVAFGIQEKYYVTDVNHSPSYFWVSKNKSDRFKCESNGFAMYKSFANAILEKASESSEEELIS